MSSHRPPVVIDNGTGYTKMGYAGCSEPSYVIPTLIATPPGDKGMRSNRAADGLQDLDFHIGYKAQSVPDSWQTNYPISHGVIDNWDHMEKIWQRSIFKYLKCEPEEHYFLLTEPPMNTPENREYTAEVMFETFNVPGLYIAVQAVLALAASWTANTQNDSKSLTGTVIDSGDGVTHVIPVADGYVISSSIRSMPIAGREVTRFVQDSFKERKEPVPPADSYLVAKTIKEKYCYVCKDVVSEYEKFDNAFPGYVQGKAAHYKQYSGVDPRKQTRNKWTMDIGFERFLAPEVFFQPQMINNDFSDSLPDVVDKAILACPIDYRRGLYNNIVLSGGSTLFKNFGKRIKFEVQRNVNARMEKNQEIHKALDSGKPKPVDVNVVSHKLQRYAVWFGGSMLCSTNEFYKVCHTKAQYDEEGPRIARYNAVFESMF